MRCETDYWGDPTFHVYICHPYVVRLRKSSAYVTIATCSALNMRMSCGRMQIRRNDPYQY